MARSFRQRLAVTTALLAGVALGGFAAIAWWQVRAAQLDALDREIRDQVERELRRPWPADHWPQHARNMVKPLGARDIRQTLLWVADGHQLVYRSEHWPPGLEPSSFPWPVAKELESRPVPPPPADDEGAPDGPRPEPLRPPLPGPQREPASANIRILTVNAGGVAWRLGLASADGQSMGIGVDLASVGERMTDLRNAYVLASPLALGFIGIGAWLTSGRALTPIRRLAATMEQVTAKGLDRRVPAAAEDPEFGRLVEVFNQMLERLERSFSQASRFSADAAHELKTPLAILQGQIERALTECEDGSRVQASLSSLLDEVQRLASISRKLLMLSLADAGRLRLNRARLDLTQTLQDLLEDAQMVAPELRIAGSIAQRLAVLADGDLLRQALHNLLSNAVKYNLLGGWIRLSAGCRQDRVYVVIENASPGIPPEDRERIFQRFYRVDRARSRAVEGAGLGLSLSREIARAHGGELSLSDSEPGVARFVLELPA